MLALKRSHQLSKPALYNWWTPGTSISVFWKPKKNEQNEEKTTITQNPNQNTRRKWLKQTNIIDTGLQFSFLILDYGLHLFTTITVRGFIARHSKLPFRHGFLSSFKFGLWAETHFWIPLRTLIPFRILNGSVTAPFYVWRNFSNKGPKFQAISPLHM